MKKHWKKGIVAAGMLVMTAGLTACGTGSGDDNKLIFQIWDQGQKDGMETLAAAYMEEHPDVEIAVEALG